MLPLCCPVVSAHASRMFSLCVPSLCGHHCCMRCVAMHCVSSHCSSLPPCSEMMFEQVTLIDPSLRDHTSHAVCASISACMCDVIQFCNLLPAGRALPRWRTPRILFFLKANLFKETALYGLIQRPYHIEEQVPPPPPPPSPEDARVCRDMGCAEM